MRKTLTALLAGILSFGSISRAQSLPVAVDAGSTWVEQGLIRKSVVAPTEDVAAYDILPIIYSLELNTNSAFNTLSSTSSILIASNVYSSSAGSVQSVLNADNPSYQERNVRIGFDMSESAFHGKVNVVTKKDTIELVGNINGKGIEITYAPNGQISGFYGDLRAQGKVVAYDKNHLPKRIVVQLGPYIYEQNATYKDGVISGHEAKRVDGKSLDSLVAAQ